MYLEHLNLVVSNLDKTLKFYQAAFPHWYVRGQGQQNWFGSQRNWVHFGDENTFITFNDKGTGENRPLNTNQLGLSHFGYVTNNLSALVERLANVGFKVDKQGSENQYRKNVYYLDPDNYEVEFVQYFSDIPNEKNIYD